MKTLWVAVAVAFTLGCAAQVRLLPGRREDVSSQARVLAIAARNLEDVTRGRGHSAGAQACAMLHADAELFARAAARWHSDDEVSTRYEKLIRTWVVVKREFPGLNPDPLTQQSYDRVAHEYQQLAKTTGYAGRHYERELEKGGK